LDLLGSSKSLHRTVSTSDVPVVTARHTPVELRLARCAFPFRSRLFRVGPGSEDLATLTLVRKLSRARGRGLTCQPSGSRLARPVRAIRTWIRERLPSYREPASRNLQAKTHVIPGLECVSLRTVSPSLHSCPASGGASSFLPASALDSHEALRLPGSEDARCVRSTSATQTTCVHPYLMELPARSHGFRGGEVPRYLGSA
jgi:hypothetical protein